LAALSQSVGKLDEASQLPLYQQLQRALRHAIETRVLGPDDALPPERDLAADFNVSRITVRKAIDGLVNEGLLVRRQGSGTFVRTRVEKNFSKLTSFSEDMRARGRNPRSVWLRRAAGTVTPEEALTLRASPGTPVFRFHRIRFADDAPMALEYASCSGCERCCLPPSRPSCCRRRRKTRACWSSGSGSSTMAVPRSSPSPITAATSTTSSRSSASPREHAR